MHLNQFIKLCEINSIQLTLITSTLLFNSPHTAHNQLSWFYTRDSLCQPNHEGEGVNYTVCLLYTKWHCLMPIILSGESVHVRAGVCVCTRGKTSSFTHSYNCKCKHEATKFFIGGQVIRSLQLTQDLVLCFKLLSVSLLK